MGKILVCFLLILPLNLAHATECFDALPVVDTFFSPYQDIAIPVPTFRDDQIHQTKMQALIIPAQNEFYIGFRYQQPPQFGIEYMLYRIEVLDGDGQMIFKTDLTKGCSEPGIPFYPGDTSLLPPLPLPASPKALWKIRIWGQMV